VAHKLLKPNKLLH